MYIKLGDVSSPQDQWTLREVIYDGGEGQHAVAVGFWMGNQALA